MQKTNHNIGLFLIRISFGLSLLIAHGIPKIGMIGTPAISQFPDPLGIGSAACFYLILFAEVVCAGLFTIGLLTRLSALIVVIGLSVAAFKFHAGEPYSGKEMALLYVYAYFPFIFTGSNFLALDSLLFNKNK